jgi:hypothetical protein
MNPIHRILTTVAATGLLISLTPQHAAATTILTYTGSPYMVAYTGGGYTTDMFMSVTIELANELAANYAGTITPLHFTFNDGQFIIDDENPFIVGTSFWIKTDGAGMVEEWENGVFVDDYPNGTLLLTNRFSTYNPFRNLRVQADSAVHSAGINHWFRESAAYVRYDSRAPAGTWGVENYPDVPTSVPESASSVGLLAIGLAGLGLLSRRRMSRAGSDMLILPKAEEPVQPRGCR